MFDNESISRMSKATAYDKDGEKIGKVGQIYADNETGEPTFATVSTGLFGTSESFVPLKGARMDGDDLRVDYLKEQVKDAPRVDDNGQLSPAEEDRLYEHYRLDAPGAGRRDDEHRVSDHDKGEIATGTAAAGTAAAGTAAAAGHERHEYRDHDREHATRDHDKVREHDKGRDHAAGTDTVTAHEERLTAGTRTEEAGRVRLRKYTTTEKETVEVPVSKEKLVVEREDVSGKARPGGLDENRTGRGEHEEEIVLREEKPVIGKETVENERVRVGKETVTGTEKVTEEVRKEHIDVDGDHGHDARHADKDVRDDRR